MSHRAGFEEFRELLLTGTWFFLGEEVLPNGAPLSFDCGGAIKGRLSQRFAHPADKLTFLRPRGVVYITSSLPNRELRTNTTPKQLILLFLGCAHGSLVPDCLQLLFLLFWGNENIPLVNRKRIIYSPTTV